MAVSILLTRSGGHVSQCVEAASKAESLDVRPAIEAANAAAAMARAGVEVEKIIYRFSGDPEQVAEQSYLASPLLTISARYSRSIAAVCPQLFVSDHDCLAFERIIADTLAKRPMRILSYCLMPNHWHLTLWPQSDGGLGRFLL